MTKRGHWLDVLTCAAIPSAGHTVISGLLIAHPFSVQLRGKKSCIKVKSCFSAPIQTVTHISVVLTSFVHEQDLGNPSIPWRKENAKTAIQKIPPVYKNRRSSPMLTISKGPMAGTLPGLNNDNFQVALLL